MQRCFPHTQSGAVPLLFAVKEHHNCNKRDRPIPSENIFPHHFLKPEPTTYAYTSLSESLKTVLRTISRFPLQVLIEEANTVEIEENLILKDLFNFNPKTSRVEWITCTSLELMIQLPPFMSVISASVQNLSQFAQANSVVLDILLRGSEF